MLKQLIYASHAVRPLADEDLLGILQGARERNARHQITGMLVYRDAVFLQVLEGEDGELDRIWAVIQADPRHENIVVIRDAEVSARDFPDWSMGFSNLSHRDLSSVPGYSKLLEEDFSPEGLRAKPGLAVDFLLDMKYFELE